MYITVAVSVDEFVLDASVGEYFTAPLLNW